MTAVCRAVLRLLATLLVAAALSLPTVVGALSEPAHQGPTRADDDICAEEDQTEVEDVERGIGLIAACLQLQPDDIEPGDDAEQPSGTLSRTAALDHRRAEVT